MNLNKQAKLYSQGMHPVVRIGEKGKWERSRDNPTYYVGQKTSSNKIIVQTLINRFFFSVGKRKFHPLL